MARATHAAIEVLRVVSEPLQADWTSELSTAGMPAVQEAIEAEAREWLEGVLGEVETVGWTWRSRPAIRLSKSRGT